MLKSIFAFIASALLLGACAAQVQVVEPVQLVVQPKGAGTPEQAADVERIRKLIYIVTTMCQNVYPETF